VVVAVLLLVVDDVGLFVVVVLEGEVFFRLWERVELFFVVVVVVGVDAGLGRVWRAAWGAFFVLGGGGGGVVVVVVDEDFLAAFRELRVDAVFWPFVLVLFRGEVVVTVSSIVCVIVMISVPRSIMLSLPWSFPSAKHAWT